MSFLDLMRQQGLTPLGSGAPMQVPGGAPGEAPEKTIERGSTLATQSQSEESSHYTQLGQLAESAAGPLARYIQTLKNAGPDPITGEQPDIFGTSYFGQIAGYGATDAASKFRQHAIKVQSPGWEKFQNWENLSGAVDSTNNDATLALQSMYRKMGRGGGQTGQDPATETIPRGNLPILQGILGNRQQDLQPKLLEKVKQPVADVFQNLGEAVAHGQYTLRQAKEALSPFGFTDSQMTAGLKAKTSPWNLTPAGGAIESNRGGHTPNAAGPLPGDGGSHGDTDGEAPPPRSTPGRLRPGKQAGVSGQSDGDVTNRSGMENTEPNQLIPKMPAQVVKNRQSQWARGVQILYKHPETTAEFDSLFTPNMPGTAKWVLSHRPKGFDQ